MNHELRVGRFTSSSISALMSNGKAKGTYGKPFYTYVQEKYFETKLGRRLDNESNARHLSWGKLVESIAFEELGTEYNLVSQETILHHTIDGWSGSPDLEKFDDGKTVCDIKCPMTLKSFCTFYECETIEDVREQHKDGEDYYWQLVSNAILIGAKYAELIVFVPYLEQLESIREAASNIDGDQNKYAWINWATDQDLPYLIPGIFYKNIKVIRFEVTESDKLLLTERVKAAIAELESMLKPKVEVEVESALMIAELDNEVNAVIITGDNDLKI